jgi:hypothetical protein
VALISASIPGTTRVEESRAVRFDFTGGNGTDRSATGRTWRPSSPANTRATRACIAAWRRAQLVNLRVDNNGEGGERRHQARSDWAIDHRRDYNIP